MAVALANSATKTGSAVTSITITVTSTTAGNYLAVAIGYDNASATVTVSDNQGQTWTYEATANNGAAQDTYIFCFPNTKAGVTSVTISFNGTSVHTSAVYGEFSGMGTGSAGDPNWSQSSASFGTTASGATTLNIPPVGANPLSTADELLLTMVNVDPKQTETFTVPSGFSLVGSVAVSTAVQVSFAWEEDTATDSPSPTWNWNKTTVSPGATGILCAIENKAAAVSVQVPLLQTMQAVQRVATF